MTHEVKAVYFGGEEGIDQLVDSVDCGYAFYEWGVLEREWRWQIECELDAYRLSKRLRSVRTTLGNALRVSLDTVVLSEFAFN